MKRFVTLYRSYPGQFWLLVAGTLLSSTGISMVWPFLTNYLHKSLNIPLTTITLMMTINSVMAILASFISGPTADRLGRRGVMLTSLFGGAVYFVLMSQARSAFAAGLLWSVWGALNPMYAVGANAMVADLVASDRRLEAYSILRIVNNVGVGIGPIFGGLLASSVSYSYAFFGAAAAYGIYGVITVFLVKETLPDEVRRKLAAPGSLPVVRQIWQGMRELSQVLKDRLYMSFTGSFLLTIMSASLMFGFLLVYSQEQYGMPESQYSWIVTVNALMCIFVQVVVTRITLRFRPLPVLAVGALFYMVGVGSIAIGNSFWPFVISMVIMTFGELIMTPTATTMVANLAPVDMRGRYMGVYTLIWPVAQGIGPAVASRVAAVTMPAALWYVGGVFGFASALWFFFISRRYPKVGHLPETPIEEGVTEKIEALARD